MILQTFHETLPNVYHRLQKRPHFVDYLMKTGIFTDPDLDRHHY